jgi:hypothetical protein
MQQSSAILGSPSNARYTEMLRHTADITCTFLSATYYPRRKKWEESPHQNASGLLYLAAIIRSWKVRPYRTVQLNRAKIWRKHSISSRRVEDAGAAAARLRHRPRRAARWGGLEMKGGYGEGPRVYMAKWARPTGPALARPYLARP